MRQTIVKVMYAYIMVHLLACQMLGQAAEEAFYREFLNPPTRYSPLPIWYWNSAIDPTIAKHQIDEYVQQGAQGAIVYPDVGLKTPFLSDGWWHVWAEILPYARAKGFVLGWVPEFNDPDGDARDVWRDPPNQSRVADGHPEYRLRRLAYVEREASGPGPVHFGDLPNPVLAIMGRHVDAGALSADTLVDASAGIHGSYFDSTLGAGNWTITFFYPQTTEQVVWTQGLHVDPLRVCNKTSATATCAARDTSSRPRCPWVPLRLSLTVCGR